MHTLLLLLGCAAEGNFTGYAYFDDAARDADGRPMEPAPVERDDGVDQPVRFETTFTGTGTFDDLLSVCIDLDGGLEGTSSAYGSLRANGRFEGDVQASGDDGEVMSSLGCVTEDFVVEQLTSLTVRAEIEADEENCSHYCEAHARAACEADQSDAECEADTGASCYQECTTVHHSIVAETTISDAATLNGLVDDDGTFGAFQANLTFTEMD